jgi:hypothetical protein
MPEKYLRGLYRVHSATFLSDFTACFGSAACLSVGAGLNFSDMTFLVSKHQRCLSPVSSEPGTDASRACCSFFLWPLGRMHQAAKLQFERTVREFAQWRAVPEADRSPAPAWSWQPAMEVVAQHEVRLLKTPCITVVAAAHLRSSLYWQAALADRFGHSRRTSERANHVHRPAPPFEPSACRNARNASRDKPAPCRHCAAASITAPF